MDHRIGFTIFWQDSIGDKRHSRSDPLLTHAIALTPDNITVSLITHGDVTTDAITSMHHETVKQYRQILSGGTVTVKLRRALGLEHIGDILHGVCDLLIGNQVWVAEPYLCQFGKLILSARGVQRIERIIVLQEVRNNFVGIVDLNHSVINRSIG